MHGIMMGHVLFNIFIKDLEMLECVFISFLKWHKMGGEPQCETIIHRNLDRLRNGLTRTLENSARTNAKSTCEEQV